MANWHAHALIAVLVGYQISVFGTVTSSGFIHNQPLLIIAFLLFTPAAVLLALLKFGEIKADFLVNICTIILLAISGESLHKLLGHSKSVDRVSQL
jgi:uncharacterized membrane protein YqaE (UPF0057 family)